MAKKTYMTEALPCRYAWILKPDTKFKADGEYSIQLDITDASEQMYDILNEIQSELEAYHVSTISKTKKKWGMASIVTEDLDGKRWIKCKAKGLYPPRVYDGKNKRITDYSLIVGAGSIVKVAFGTYFWQVAVQKNVGVSLTLKAVQILDLKSAGETSMFDTVDDGFEFNETSGDVFNTSEDTGKPKKDDF